MHSFYLEREAPVILLRFVLKVIQNRSPEFSQVHMRNHTLQLNVFLRMCHVCRSKFSGKKAGCVSVTKGLDLRTLKQCC